jgi:flotillin
MQQKAKEQAEQQARVDVAEMTMRGEMGDKDRKVKTRINLEQQETLAQQTEYEMATEREKAKSQNVIQSAIFQRDSKIAQLEADKAAEMRMAQLMQELEKQKALQEVETLRASNVTKATVEAEAKIKVAEGEARAIQMMADAKL